jgi:fibronectin type 3 domain-containing protein
MKHHWLGRFAFVFLLCYWALPWRVVFAQTTPHNVTITWNAPVVVGGSGTIAGYNTYRSTTSGGPYTKITATLATGLIYVDTTVVSGTKYFYVVTTVDSKGFESVDSSEVTATAVGNPNPPTGVQAVAN